MSEAPGPTPVRLTSPVLVDTGVWSWARDRRFPALAAWFNAAVAAGYVLTCELVIIELTRTTADAEQATVLREQLSPIERVPMREAAWSVAAQIQLDLAASDDHRRVPPADLLIAATALDAGVPVVHYDRDYERIAQVADLDQRWFVQDGSLAG